MPKVPQNVKILENKKISIFQNLKIHFFLFGRWQSSTVDVDANALFLVDVDQTAFF